jgi:hypothetical protein
VARRPFGPLWVHEIKHDGYQLMVRRDGLRVPASRAAVMTGLTASRPSLMPRSASKPRRRAWYAFGLASAALLRAYSPVHLRIDAQRADHYGQRAVTAPLLFPPPNYFGEGDYEQSKADGDLQMA